MSFYRKYGTGTGADIWIPVIKRGVVDYALSADWTPAAGDVKVTKDGGAAANIGTLPVALTMGNTALWKFVFADAELECKVLTVTVSDEATKAVEDQCIPIETFGHASAQYPTDFSVANLTADIRAVASGVLNAAAFNADMNKYQAKVWLADDNTGTNDRYAVAWYKNGQPITSSITSPTIQVWNMADGADLVASTAMTEAGSTGTYRYTEGTNRIVDGTSYMVKVSATIDSATRTWLQPISRDS